MEEWKSRETSPVAFARVISNNCKVQVTNAGMFILHINPYLQTWIDRDISFELGSDLSADIVSLPRLVTSRSHEKLSDDSRLTSKQNVKLSIVERAAFNIGRG